VYIVWHDFTDNLVPLSGSDVDIYLKQKSIGEQWSEPKLISSDSTGVSYAPNIVCNNENDIHISWTDNTDILGADVDEDIFYKSFDYSTQVWSEIEVVSSQSVSTSTYSTIVLDDFNNLHIVWHDYSDYSYAGLDGDIFYRRKDLLENTWITTNVVCSEENTGISQYPDIALDKTGYIYTIWQDTSNLYDAGGDYDIFFRKFVGPPQIPILSSFTTNPTQVGNISIDWNNAIGT